MTFERDRKSVRQVDEGARLKLRIEHWFEPPSSLNDAYWPMGLAVSWIVWRDSQKAEEEWERFRHHGRVAWLLPADGQKLIEPIEACRLVRQKLRSGHVRSSAIRNGERRKSIEPVEWLELSFDADPHDTMEHVNDLSGQKICTSFVVHGGDVSDFWPVSGLLTTGSKGIFGKAKPGPKPEKRMRVLAQMLKEPPDVLDQMKLVEMAAKFGAAETTCREVRRLAQEQRSSLNTNSDQS